MSLVSSCTLPPESDAKQVNLNIIPVALRGFYEMALWYNADVEYPIQVQKWEQPLQVRITGAGPNLQSFIRVQLSRMAGVADLPLKILDTADTAENLSVNIVGGMRLYAGTIEAQCLTNYEPDQDLGINFTNTEGRDLAYTHVHIAARTDNGPRALSHCLIHEFMHAFGFPGHPHDLDTILSYKKYFSELTLLDLQSLKILYHPTIHAGMHHAEALQAARRILAHQHNGGDSNDDAENGWLYIKSSMDYLATLSKKNPARAWAFLLSRNFSE